MMAIKSDKGVRMRYNIGDIIETYDGQYWKIVGENETTMEDYYECKSLSSDKTANIAESADIKVYVQTAKCAPAIKPDGLGFRRTTCEFCKHCIYVKENSAGTVIRCKKLETKVLCKKDSFIRCKFKLNKFGKAKIKNSSKTAIK